MFSTIETSDASSPICLCTAALPSLPVISFMRLARPIMKRSLVA
jgi:hypothetical protein